MSNPDILFRGIPRGRTRGYTADVIKAVKPKRVIIPCTGSFALVSVAVDAGVPASGVTCGDISLYSTAMGHALMDQPFNVRIISDEAGTDLVAPLLETGDPLEVGTGVLFMIRLLQWHAMKPSAHTRDHILELHGNAAFYQNQIRTKIKALREKVRGLHYVARDMWETLDAHQNDPDAVLLVNPPRYTGGYDRMFEGADRVFAWETPSATQFTENDYARLMDQLGSQPSLTLMYYATPAEDPASLWGPPWRSVFADKPGSNARAAINWIISNREPIPSEISRAQFDKTRGPYRLFDDTCEITPTSVLSAQTVDGGIGQYYRDLFVHRLATGNAERSVALFLDGRLLGMAGVSLAAYYGRQARKRVEDRIPGIVFAFTAPSTRYKRLQKLTLMSLASSWFWTIPFQNDNFMTLLGVPARVSTSMLTPYPEVKTARGVMKLIRREEHPDGGYKLVYESDIHKRTPSETLNLWLKKFNKA